MVSSTMLVVVYAPLLHLSFLLLLTRLVIGLDQIHGVSPVVGTQVHSHGPTDQEMEKRIPPVLLIKEGETDTSETEMAQEQSVRKHTCTPTLHLKNQHLNQVCHQMHNRLLPILCHIFCCLKPDFPSWKNCTIKSQLSTGHGSASIVDA